MASTSLNESLQICMDLVNSAKKNKAHLNKYTCIIRQIMNALNGWNYSIIRHAEFYQDLKETLNKIHSHISILTQRPKVLQIMMAKKESLVFTQIQQHIDNICGRIVLSSARKDSWLGQQN